MKKFEWWMPVKPATVTQKFGRDKTDPQYLSLYEQMGLIGHPGWDIVGYEGQVCRAAHDGIVSYAGEDSSGGLGIVIRTKEKFEYQNGEANFKSIFWHLKPGSIKVKVGDEVRVGDIIAECDSTPPGLKPHLHLGIKAIGLKEDNWTWYNLEQINGYFGNLDPELYWNGQYAEAGGVMYQIINILKKVVTLLMQKK